LRIGDLIERDLEKLASTESIDAGKPFTLARPLATSALSRTKDSNPVRPVG
jgi:hypothetical protein